MLCMQGDPASCAAAEALASQAPAVARQEAPAVLSALLLHADCSVSGCSFCEPLCAVALWPAVLGLLCRGACEARAALQSGLNQAGTFVNAAQAQTCNGSARPSCGDVQAVSRWHEVWLFVSQFVRHRRLFDGAMNAETCSARHSPCCASLTGPACRCWAL